MAEKEFACFKADIAENGLREEIVLYDGMILDGRHRYRACSETGTMPRFREHHGDPLAFVLSANLQRRHLDESQRAMVAARLATLKQGARTDLAPNGARSQADAASALNVSRRALQRATIVLTLGIPELIRAVDTGRVAVSLAAAILGKHPLASRQRAVVAKIEKCPDRVLTVVRDFNRSMLFAEMRREAKKCAPGAFDGPYAVVYADPPWRFRIPGGEHAPENHYETIPTEEICALKIFDRPASELALPDAILFVWVPPCLFYPDAIRVVEAWGFRYVTHMVWIKPHIGIGNVIRNQHENLILAKRGNFPAPETSDRPSSVFEARVLRHSAKPPEVREMIETMYPGVPKIELFARGEEPEGWRFWGYEARRQ